MHNRGPVGKVVKAAAHALAKLLVTTNPGLLPQSKLMDSMSPLLELIRSNDQLSEFEGLLALTNILSEGMEYKERAMELGALRVFEFCQFSDNHMVRRAATEALSNLIPLPSMFEHMKESKDRVKLWLGLIEDWDTDFEGAFEAARAAAGGLAMLCQDPDIADIVIGFDGLAMMLALLQTENEEMKVRVRRRGDMRVGGGRAASCSGGSGGSGGCNGSDRSSSPLVVAWL